MIIKVNPSGGALFLKNRRLFNKPGAENAVQRYGFFSTLPRFFDYLASFFD